AELAHQALKLELQSPFDIAWLSQSSQAHIASHCWLHEEARLCLDEDATLSAEQGQAALSLKNLSLQKFNPLLPETAQLAGTLATDIRSEWRGGALPTVDLKAHVSELALSAKDADGQPISVIFDQAQIDAELGENQGKLDLLLHSQEQGKTQIKANLDPATRALSGTVNLEGFLLGPLKALLPMLDTLRGEISASGEFSGTVDDPKFKGQVRLKNPAVAGSQVPLTVEDGQLKLDIDGRSATLNAEFITAPSGTLRISGDAKYTDKLRANIALDGEELALLLPPTIDATINHSLTLAYDAEQLKLRGKIHIPDAVIVLEGMSGSGPSLSKDMVLTDPEDRPAQGDKQDTALQIDMDLQAQIDDEVRLSGYGFDTRLKGDIKVRQRIGQPPQLAGQLELKDGQYQAYGQDLAVRRGELLFVGPMRSTRVDVTAVRVVDDVEAGLELGGDLISPQVTLFSEPAMADADILSYIVLGGPPGAGGDESAMLARAALGLGLKNGNHIAGQFASAAGIEDFNIGADGQGEDTAVVLSGRLSPKLLLSYRMSIFDAANTLTARYDLSQALYLELMRGVEQAIDLIYSVDY
ncbi:MAG: translocation/assembly module TamB domain-containing protein, partial [Granulosicoccaceae bacterium]